jgi:hypothetical protein
MQNLKFKSVQSGWMCGAGFLSVVDRDKSGRPLSGIGSVVQGAASKNEMTKIV